MLLPNVYKLGYNAGQCLSGMLNRHSLPEAVSSPSQAYHFLLTLPSLYKTWWLNLVNEDPIHVFIETTLLLSIVYMIVASRKKDYKHDNRETLTKKEEEDLLQEWKTTGRSPLAPEKVSFADIPVVSTMNGRTMEVILPGGGDKPPINVWVSNFATNDFLGMSVSEPVKTASKQALAKYGCGSCGPRGFYGTIDVHLQLEERLAQFMGTDGSIMYSDGASTVSSTVAAFAKRGDLLVVDDGVSEPLVTGVTLSRANVKWFRHNDMANLECVLKEVQTTDKKLGRKPSDQRRFIVTEGLYKNSGTIVPLDELVKLKHKYHYRLILDESLSFGTLGPTGKGVVELYGKRPMYDAEIICVSLENALGSVGGLTVGNEEVVDHQRLSGAGYCFSASSPPFTASAAIAALEELQTKGEILERLQKNTNMMYSKLRKALSDCSDVVSIVSDDRSPIVLLELNGKFSAHDVAEECLLQRLACVAHQEPEAIRLVVSSSHTESDIEQAVAILVRAVRKKSS